VDEKGKPSFQMLQNRAALPAGWSLVTTHIIRFAVPERDVAYKMGVKAWNGRLNLGLWFSLGLFSQVNDYNLLHHTQALLGVFDTLLARGLVKYAQGVSPTHGTPF
jgi:hypothetical protein